MSALLYAEVGLLEGSPHKAAVVGLRRAIGRGRRPSRRELEIGRSLNPELAHALDGYLHDREQMTRTRGLLITELLRAQAAIPEVTAELVEAPQFSYALQLASPSLAAEVAHWQSSGRVLQRQKLLRLAKYLARATVKVSPYSTFTVVGRAAWADEADPADPADPDDRPEAMWETRKLVSFLELDGEFLTAVRSALTRHPALLDDLPLRVNPSLTCEPDAVRFLGRGAREPVLQLAATSALLASIELTREHGVAGRREVVRRLAERSGQDADRAERYLERLLQAGVLQADPPVDDHDPRPWQSMSAWLDRSAAPELAPVSSQVAVLAEHLDQPSPLPDGPAHRRRIALLRSAATEIGRELNVRGEATLHETVANPDIEPVSQPAWALPALAELDVVSRWLALFDPSLTARVALAEWFGSLPPAERPSSFLDLHRLVGEILERSAQPRTTFERDLARVMAQSGSPWLADTADCASPRLRELAALRMRAAAILETSDRRVELAPDALVDQLAAFPQWLRPPRSIGGYVQFVEPDQRLVVNAMHIGHGRADGRLARVSGRSAVRSAECTLPGLMEFGATFSSSLNRRDGSAGLVLDYPYASLGRRREPVVPLGDLEIRRNAADGLLHVWSRSLGTDVMPCHLGMSAEFALPPAARLLERCFGESLLVHPSAPPLVAFDTSRSGGREHYPRISVGRVVLQRERWCLPTATLQNRTAGLSDADRFLVLAERLAESGIADHFFARGWSGGGTAAAKARKPVYCDLAAPALFSLLEKLIEGSRLLVVEEALPDPLVGPGETQTTEYFVELTRRSLPGGTGTAR